MRHFSGEFDGMRLLMEDELDLVAGGDGEDADQIPDMQTVVVVAQPEKTTYYMPNLLYWGGGPFSGVTVHNPEPTDKSAVHVDVKITRPLTALEQLNINDLNIAIREMTFNIAAINDTATLTLFNGQTVTGAELKDLWAKTDFVVNDNNTMYGNGTSRSAADYNNGDPVISINLSLLGDYDAVVGGMNYLVRHELAHMTNAGRYENNRYNEGQSTNELNERIANDIAWAIAGTVGDVAILPDSGPQAPTIGGYSPDHPYFRGQFIYE